MKDSECKAIARKRTQLHRQPPADRSARWDAITILMYSHIKQNKMLMLESKQIIILRLTLSLSLSLSLYVYVLVCLFWQWQVERVRLTK